MLDSKHRNVMGKMEQTVVLLTNIYSRDSSIYFQFYTDGEAVFIKV